MEKIRQNKEIVIAVVVILAVTFHWVQIRPVTAKRECSWVAEIIPADAGVTREEAEANKKALGILLGKCGTTIKVGPFRGLSGVTVAQCRNTIERPAQPEGKIVREATKSEYDKCLRYNGL